MCGRVDVVIRGRKIVIRDTTTIRAATMMYVNLVPQIKSQTAARGTAALVAKGQCQTPTTAVVSLVPPDRCRTPTTQAVLLAQQTAFQTPATLHVFVSRDLKTAMAMVARAF